MGSEIRPIADDKREILANVIPLDTPYTIYIFPTNFCNFSCNYCGHSLGTEKMIEEYDFNLGIMNMDTFEKIIDQISHFPKKLKVLSLTGHGEPLLNKNLSKMIKYAKDKKVADRIEFISNGSILTNELSDKLLDAGLDCLRISVQGISESKYKDICGYEIDFKKFIDRITYFYNRKGDCKLYVKTMDIALDEGEENIFYKIFENISDRMFIEECRPVYSGVESTKDIKVQRDRYGREHQGRKVCPLCFFSLGILPNGDVKPCDSIYKPIILGNIRETEILDMWNGKELNKFRLIHLREGRYVNEKCRVCCAPDDVSHPQDELDQRVEELVGRFV